MFRPVEDDDGTNEFMKHWTKRRTKKNVGNEMVDSNKEERQSGATKSTLRRRVTLGKQN